MTTTFADISSRASAPGRIRALDGLRGFAVVAVVLYHFNLSWMVGGFLGVSTFFTLSGFVITRLLLTEQQRSGRIALGEFYRRRLRRLMPASLTTVLVVTGVLMATGAWNSARRTDVLAILGQVANWQLVFGGHGYSALFGPASPFKHFWSLAIEEQFYLAFPALLLLTLRKGGGRKNPLTRARLVIGALVIASVVAGHFGSRSGRYFRTDVRAAELLAGSMLALFEAHIVRAARWLRIAGPAALVGFAALFPLVTTESPRLYSLVLPLSALLSVTVVASASLARSPLARLLGSRPFVVVGNVSYPLYLVHWPIVVLVQGTAVRVVAMVGAAVALQHLTTRKWVHVSLSIRRVLASTAVLAMVGFFVPVTSANASRSGPDPAVAGSAGSAGGSAGGPAGGLSILVVGDSTGDFIGRALAERPGVTVTNISRHGCPMFLDDSVVTQLKPDGAFRTWKGHNEGAYDCDWKHFIDEAKSPFDVVLLAFGPTMLPTYRVGDAATDVTQPEGRRFITDLVLAAQAILVPKAPRIVWLTAPVSQPPPSAPSTLYWTDPTRADAWNDVEREVAARTGGEVIDFSTWLLAQPDHETFRPDGTHLGGPGAVPVSTWILDQLQHP
jgi:peptidoglycan/LPS O-acetylase OafA/YrhL